MFVGEIDRRRNEGEGRSSDRMGEMDEGVGCICVCVCVCVCERG